MLPICQIPLPTPWPSVGPVHAYLVREDPITLIDTGVHTPASRTALLDGLKACSIHPREIRRLLLTHAHLDHFGQAAWIQEESGAEVYLHPDEEGKLATPDWWLEGRNLALNEAGMDGTTQQVVARWWKEGRKICLPLERWTPLADGQRFAFATGELEAVHLPGHALGHTGFWEAQSCRLVGGDHLLERVTPNPIMEVVRPGHPAAVPHAPGRALTLGMFLDALHRVRAMPVAQVLPGHGPIIDDHRAMAENYLARHQRRLDGMWERIKTGRTAWDLTRELYPRVQGFDLFLALSEVLAHLDLLVVCGRAFCEPDESGCRYLAI